jgi:hypothetical protein
MRVSRALPLKGSSHESTAQVRPLRAMAAYLLGVVAAGGLAVAPRWIETEEQTMKSMACAAGVSLGFLTASALAQDGNQVLSLPAGSNPAMEIAHAAIQHAPADAGAMTIEFWLKGTGVGGAQGRPVAKRGCSSSGYTIQFRQAGVVQAELGGVCDLPTPFPVNQWTHYAVTWSRTQNVVQTFVNGEPVASAQPSSTQLQRIDGSLRFGDYCGQSTHGALDNIRIWSVARTQAEIARDMVRQFTADEAAATGSLVGAWSFEALDPRQDDAGRNPLGQFLGGASVIRDDSLPIVAPGRFARFDSVSDTIRIAGNTVFNGGNFTYEMRIRLEPGTALGHVIAEQRDSLEDKVVMLSGSGAFTVSACRDNPAGNVQGVLEGFQSGVWHHIAYVRDGSQLKFFVDGTLVRSSPFISCYGDRSDSWMSIGMFRYGAGLGAPTGAFPSFLGDLDWIRVSSVARYSTNFAAPFECEVESDAQTQLLLKFNEPSGTATIVDESPNRFDCQLGVPVAPGVTATLPSLGMTDGGFPPCPLPCSGDVDGSRSIDGVDLAIVLQNWGAPSAKYPGADINADGEVNGSDLAIVLAGWGACP